MKVAKRYLGDGVYAEVPGDGYLWLTTEDGIRTTNRIALDDEVLASFLDYLDAVKTACQGRRETPLRRHGW